MTSIDTTVSSIVSELEVKNSARDKALTDSRQLVRHAAVTIRSLHRGEYEAAGENVAAGRQMADQMRHALDAHPDLYWAGYTQDALKEYAEACLVSAMIQQHEVPGPEEIGVENAAYLNGLAEAASELRRYVLDIIRRGGESEMREAERALGLMDDVYTNLITVDYPDAVTGGLRRTTDQLRGVLERTRGDLTISLRQAELERALQRRP